jgi:hypothetical protein
MSTSNRRIQPVEASVRWNRSAFLSDERTENRLVVLADELDRCAEKFGIEHNRRFLRLRVAAFLYRPRQPQASRKARPHALESRTSLFTKPTSYPGDLEEQQ